MVLEMRNWKFIKSTLILLLFMIFSWQVVYGLPAPFSKEELQDKSDLIVEAKVLGVICTKEDYYNNVKNLPKVYYYQAWLKLLKVEKGILKPNDSIIVEWSGTPKGLIGPWSVDYFPGQIVNTHLILDKEKNYYKTTWWNATNTIKKSSITLPKNIGKVVYLDK